MVDVHTPEQRRRNMSRIRGRDTKPEMLVRRGLHARGLRYRLQDRSLPGRPDLVFPRHRAVVFVHGCFWHGHHCPMFRLPATRREFWQAKINGNQVRDAKSLQNLLVSGWRVLTVWECCLKSPGRPPLDAVIDKCVDFIVGTERTAEISGPPLV